MTPNDQISLSNETNTIYMNKIYIWKFQVPYRKEFLYKYWLNLEHCLKLSQYQNHQVELFKIFNLYPFNLLFWHLRLFLRINFDFSNLDVIFFGYVNNELLKPTVNTFITICAIQSRICAYLKLSPFYFVLIILLYMSPA